MEAHALVTDIPTLSVLLTAWLELQPKSTRGYAQITRGMEDWLVKGTQKPKMQLIAEVYQNTLGSDNSINYLESITDFLGEVRIGLNIVEQRLSEGVQWVAFWDGMCLKLSDARTLLPQVQLQVSPRSEII